MPMIFNMIGLAALLIGVVVSALLGFAFGQKVLPVQALIIGCSLIGLDLLYRKKLYKPPEGEKTSLFHFRKGGHFFFIPAWILGIPVLLLAVALIVKRGFIIQK
jgi:hypothetical protein